MQKEGYEPILKKARYCFLKLLENLTDGQLDKLADITRYDLRTNRAYFLKEAFDGFWKYNSPQWARWFLRKWCARTMRSRLEPMKKFVRTLRKHEDLLMNYFKELEQRRRQAVLLYRKGEEIVEIARLVGSHRNTVGRWISVWEDGGVKALKPKRRGVSTRTS